MPRQAMMALDSPSIFRKWSTSTSYLKWKLLLSPKTRMPRIKTVKPKTFADIVGIIEDLRDDGQGPLWYRGIGDVAHDLTPSLYRHRGTKTPADYYKLESRLMTRFRQRSIPFHDRDLSDDWNAMFFMQHYGVPTRLLDWSESPFIALHFAMMGCPSKRLRDGTTQYTKQNALWILRPHEWNKHALSHIGHSGEILTPKDEGINGHSTTVDFKDMAVSPIAVYGAHNSPRIVAQRGAFTVFGQKAKSMEMIVEEETFPTGCLTKLLIEPRYVDGIKNSVLNHGVTESVVYPDLSGLALEIRREAGF